MDAENTHQKQEQGQESQLAAPDVDFGMASTPPPPMQLQAGEGFEAEGGSAGQLSEAAPMQLARYQPSRPGGRLRKPTFLQAIAELDFITAPSYTSSGIAGAGGAHSRAVIGPTGSWMGGGSDADSSQPAYIKTARKKYPGSNFKAGHLLNANFGGDGKDPSNLTILSATGNANHKAFDEPVKKAIMLLREAYAVMWEDGIDVSSAGIGVFVSVMVNTGEPWPNETKIFSGLQCSASVQDAGTIASEFENSGNRDRFLDLICAMDSLCIEATFAGEIANPP